MLGEAKWLTQDHTAGKRSARSGLHTRLTGCKGPAMGFSSVHLRARDLPDPAPEIRGPSGLPPL